MDTGEPLPYIEVTDAADALSKQTASRGTTAKHQWKTARKYCTFRKNERKRQETLERITSDYGTQLRMNRSIQAEGSFANIKEDMEFRRYLYRGNANVTAQSILLAIGYNINKLHHKIQAGRTGRHLFPLKQTA